MSSSSLGSTDSPPPSHINGSNGPSFTSETARIVLPTSAEPRLRIAAADRLTAQHQEAAPAAGGATLAGAGATGETAGGAGEVFLRNARAAGIDTTLLWALIDSAGTRVDEACLAVVGSGKTAMLFISAHAGGPSVTQEQLNRDRHRRVALIRHACAHVARPEPPPAGGGGARLAQALLEPRERASIEVFQAAGFLKLGDLAYLRRSSASLVGIDDAVASPSLTERLGAGYEVHTLADLHARVNAPEADRLLIEAMSASYEQTLDCPELCGLRDPADVLESHKAVGAHDPALWWVVLDVRGHRPQGVGCMFLTPCPDQGSVELVYLGIGPSLRGKGLARCLLAEGLRTLEKKSSRWLSSGPATGGVTCAVDMRNTPALALYRGMGFQQFATRVPLVLGLLGQ